METNGLLEQQIAGTPRTEDQARETDREHFALICSRLNTTISTAFQHSSSASSSNLPFC